MYQLELIFFLRALGVTLTEEQQDHLHEHCLGQEHYFSEEFEFLESNLYSQFLVLTVMGKTINSVLGRFLDSGYTYYLDHNVKDLYETAAAGVRLLSDQLVLLQRYARTDFHWIEGEKYFLMENIAIDKVLNCAAVNSDPIHPSILYEYVWYVSSKNISQYSFLHTQILNIGHLRILPTNQLFTYFDSDAEWNCVMCESIYKHESDRNESISHLLASVISDINKCASFSSKN